MDVLRGCVCVCVILRWGCSEKGCVRLVSQRHTQNKTKNTRQACVCRVCVCVCVCVSVCVCTCVCVCVCEAEDILLQGENEVFVRSRFLDVELLVDPVSGC